jgi:hypothetical protein
MIDDHRAARFIARLLGFLALLVLTSSLLIACTCSPDKPYCDDLFPNAAPRQ